MTTTAQLIEDNLVRIFANPNRYERHMAVVEIYARDVRFSDAEGTISGMEAVEARAGELFAQAPEGFRLLSHGPVYLLGERAALPWALGPEGGSSVVSGLDIVTVRDGKITEIETLIVNPR